jgi:methylthioribose-1-phosphate isomerase
MTDMNSASANSPLETLSWQGGRPGHVQMVEQTLLPTEFLELEVRTVDEMVDAIYRLAVRGAPAIGVAAAYGVLLGVQNLTGSTAQEVMASLKETCDRLAKSRPTAVNLFWALERMSACAESSAAAKASGDEIIGALFEEAASIHSSDKDTCQRMGAHGAELIRDGARILTHCNAGSLATGGMGTALAPIYTAAQQGKRVSVYADETRPLLQGARLTAFELMRAGIETTLITDNTAGWVMREGRVDMVIVGSDRIARNGDVCNKIGTYSVAVLAREHGIPFFVVAPLSTFDMTIADGSRIPIEERPSEEVTNPFGRRIAPEDCKVYSPAFDVTPAGLVSGIVTEVGILRNPTSYAIEAAFKDAGLEIPELLDSGAVKGASALQ